MDRQTTLALILVLVSVTGLSWAFFGQGEKDIVRAQGTSERYLESLGETDLAIAEVMEFEENFYVIYYEKSTGIGAFEMLIDKESGWIFPEYGPNMIWNTKYGHGDMMGKGGMMEDFWSGEQTVDEAEAVRLAQAFLDERYPGTVADDPHPFYGYYTLHTVKNDLIFGMLSVNSYTGVVWYHDWHGAYKRSLEDH
jgi:hypothetical protein